MPLLTGLITLLLVAIPAMSEAMDPLTDGCQGSGLKPTILNSTGSRAIAGIGWPPSP
jgi:hypothetical protein